MIVAIKKMVCLLLICCFGNVLKADISIPFEMINGLIVVEAEINGQLGNYIVDSGANGLLLNGNSSHSDVSYQTLNSTLEGSEAIIESFKIGEFETKEVIGFTTDLSNLEVYLEKSLAGILGCSIFNPSTLLFDFKNEKLVISDQGLDSKAIIGYSSFKFQVVEDIPLTTLRVNGESRVFIIDTGASSHFFDSNIIEVVANQCKATGVEKDIFTASGQEDISKEYIVPHVLMGKESASIKAFQKDFSLISKSLGKEISGLLSLSKLTTGQVYFDLNSQTLYYK